MPITITNREGRAIYNALTELASRTLPDIAADLRVGRLIRKYFKPISEDCDRARERVVKDNPIVGDSETAVVPRALEEKRVIQMNEFLDDKVEIEDIPETLLLQERDLPKALKSGMQEDNRAGLANILGILPEWLFKQETE